MDAPKNDDLNELEERIEAAVLDPSVGLETLLDMGRELQNKVKAVADAERATVKQRLIQRSANMRVQRKSVGAMMFWLAANSL
jgi:hypothetical protein